MPTRIALPARIAAYVIQVASRFFPPPRKELYFGQRRVAKPAQRLVPTRHGPVSVLIYLPPVDAPDSGGAGRPRPVHVQIHGGGFYRRDPLQDDHVATYLASETGAVVVGIDYDVAPQAQYPIAEEQCFDVAAWVHHSAASAGWDAGRISIGGYSAGGKLAINVCQIAHATNAFRPCALVAAYAVADVTRTDRRSAKRRAKISPAIQRLVAATYFADERRRSEPLASPLMDEHLASALPRTLILTGEYDTLAPEMDRLAEWLAAAGVLVVHRSFARTDHGFTHGRPVHTAREAIGLIGAFLNAAYTVI